MVSGGVRNPSRDRLRAARASQRWLAFLFPFPLYGHSERREGPCLFFPCSLFFTIRYSLFTVPVLSFPHRGRSPGRRNRNVDCHGRRRFSV